MFIKNFTIDSDLKSKEAVQFEAQTNCKSKEVQPFCANYPLPVS